MVSMLARAPARLYARARRSLAAMGFLLAAMLVAAAPAPAAAQGMIGASVTYAQEFPTLGNRFSAGSATVSDAVEFTHPTYTVDVTATQITFTARLALTPTGGAAHNGPVLNFDGTIDSFSVNSATNAPYVSVTVSGGSIRFNLSGVTIPAGAVIVVDVDYTPATPGLAIDTPASGAVLATTTPTITGTATPGATVHVEMDTGQGGGFQEYGTSTASGDGAWSFLTAGLPTGAISLRVREDVAGVYSAHTATRTFTVAGTAPGWTTETGLYSGAAGGAQITIDGTNLSGASVTINGAAATVTGNTATQVTFLTPPNPVGNYNVVITTNTGTVTVEAGAQYISGISISTAFDTPSIAVGSSTRLTFTLTRPNLNRQQVGFSAALPAGLQVAATPNAANAGGCTSVIFAPAAGADVIALTGARMNVASCTFSVDVTATSSGAKTVTPDPVSGTVGGTVIAGETPSGATLTVAGAPTVTSLSPASGSAAGGASVVVTGTDFSDATGVSFGATAAADFTVDSATQITATAPAGSGVVDVSVTTAGGTSDTAGTGDDFTYLAALTTSLGFSADPLLIGAEGVLTVTFGNPNAAASPAFSASVISNANVGPPLSAGGTCTGYTLGGDGNAVISFSGLSVPAGGCTVTIPYTGRNAGDAAFSLNAFTPAGLPQTPADSLRVRVAFPAPVVISVSPSGGPAQGGNVVTITGAGFETATGVVFGSTPATSFTVDSDTQITATVPLYASSLIGSTVGADVSVATDGGDSDTSGTGDDYTYVGVPGAPGLNGGDGFTTGDNTPEFSGAAQAGSTVELFVDGQLAGTTTAAGNTNWILTVPTLSDGAHTVYATASNIGGRSAASTTWTFTVDTTAPSTPVIRSPTSGVLLQAVTTVSGAGDPLSRVVVYINDGSPTPASAPAPGVNSEAQRPGFSVFGSADVDASGLWTVQRRTRPGGVGIGPQAIASVGETPVQIYAIGTDIVDNQSGESNTVTLTTDIVPPVPPVITGPTPGQTYQIGTPTFTGTAEPGSNIEVYVDGGLNGRTTATASGTWSYNYTDPAPSGLAAPSGDGRQSGLSAGSHSVYTISTDPAGNSATSATVSFNVVLLSINETSLANGAVASAYSATLTLTGCTGPCTFAVTAGALPAGVALSSAGVFSGTPTAGGSFNFTVTATDAGAGGTTASQAFTLTVAAPTITSASTLPAASRGFAYSQTLTGSGGTGPYTFALQSGALPAGITLSAGGVLAGTPTVTGSFPITVRITDSSTGSGPYSGDVALTLVVNAATLSVTPATLPNVMAGAPYDAQLSSTGGSGAVTFAVTSGALPTGLTLSTTGRISGASYQVGQANFTVTATDAFGNTGSVALRILITARPDPSQDPDVRGLDAAQAEATRRLTSTQIDNFSRRLEQLHVGGGDQPVSIGLSVNAGVADLARQADQRTQLAGGRMFDRQSVDPDRAELTAMLWGDANQVQVMGGGSDAVGLGAATGSAGGGIAGSTVQSGGASSGGVRVWTGGAITIGERDADTGQASFSVRSSGISLGADVAVTPNFDLGFGGGFGKESADIGSADTAADSQQFSGVVYASYRPQPGVYVDAMLGYGSLEFDLQRRVTGDGSLVRGERDGSAAFGSIGLGYDQPVSVGRLNAYGRVESLNATLDAYTETGSALWALSYGERDVESLQGVVGARYVWSHEDRDSVWTPGFRLEYRHEFADGGLQSLQYADWLTGPIYQIRSTGWDRSELNLGLSLNVSTTEGWKVGSELGARLSTNQTAGTLRLTLSKVF